MIEIVKWLRQVEHLASEAYSQGADVYLKDTTLHHFLKENAEDEAWHYHVMGSAAEYLSSVPHSNPAIKIDKHTREKIFNYLGEIQKGVEDKSLTREKLIELIVRLELSEWNDIFFYVINHLKEQTTEFKYPAIRFQAHLKNIENFVSKVEQNSSLLNKIKEIPSIWIEKILIVDDEKPILKLVKALLNKSGNIDTALNGAEALKMIENNYYKLIISDIDMPKMDGISLYKNISKTIPSINNRFLFMTGNTSQKRKDYFTQQQVDFIEKPMDICLLREKAEKILLCNSKISS